MLLKDLLFFLNTHPFVLGSIEVFFIFLTTYISVFVTKKIIFRLHRRFQRNKSNLDTAFIIAIKKPIYFLIWAIGIIFITKAIGDKVHSELNNLFLIIRTIIINISIVWFFLRLIQQYKKRTIARLELKGENIDYNTIDTIEKIARIFVIIIAIISAMQKIGFNLKGILAFSGASGIVLGFASKDLLSNIFGAVILYFDKPFNVGDWIRSPDRDIEGTVQNIGWRQTKILTFEKHPMYVPNSIFSTIVIENRSRMQGRRIREYIGVRFDDMEKVKKITDDIKAMLFGHPEITKKFDIIVALDKITDFSASIFIMAFTHTTVWVKYQEVKQDVLIKISDIITSNGAKIAVPATTVNFKDKDELVEQEIINKEIEEAREQQSTI